MKATKTTWSQLKTAATDAAGSAWDVIDGDSRYLTLLDPATGRKIQAYHVDGKTVLAGATISMRETARRLAEELQTAHRFGGLGDFTRLNELGK